MRFLALTLASFAVMEGVAYIAHRHLFHGVFWRIHRSHHRPRTGAFELNDLFAVLFAPIAIVLMGGWLAPDWRWLTFPIGTGMTCYGLMYFLVHDVYTHRRCFNFRFKWKWLESLRAAHRHHHSCALKKGQEPFGFLFYKTTKFEKIR